MDDGAMTTAEIARYLGVTQDVIQKLTREGRIPHIRLTAHNIRYPKNAVDAWMLEEARAAMGPPGLGLVADG